MLLSVRSRPTSQYLILYVLSLYYYTTSCTILIYLDIILTRLRAYILNRRIRRKAHVASLAFFHKKKFPVWQFQQYYNYYHEFDPLILIKFQNICAYDQVMVKTTKFSSQQVSAQEVVSIMLRLQSDILEELLHKYIVISLTFLEITVDYCRHKY